MGGTMTPFFSETESPEGATPITDYSGLKPKWVHTKQDLNRVEAENILEAQRKLLRHTDNNPTNWFGIKELRKIHQTMFGNVWDWAGIYRKSHTSIGIRPSLIPSQLAAFCIEVQSWSKYPVELTFIEMSARIHHQLVFIHPFENGNGRFSRFVSDRFLLSWRCSHPNWPSNLNKTNSDRKKYIQALKNADKGNYDLLIKLMKHLHAKDPTIADLLSSKFYRKFLDSTKLCSLIKALLRHGHDPNETCSKGHRPLHLAIQNNEFEIVHLLLNSGADLNMPDQTKLSPFQLAVLQKNKLIADLLVSKGANN